MTTICLDARTGIGPPWHFKPRQRAEVRALRAKKGVRAAIARARKLAN